MTNVQGAHIWSVHSTGPDAAGAVEIIFRTEREARSYAQDRSNDWPVTAVSVTRFTVGQLGTRTAIAWYVDGVEQPPRARRPGRLYPTDGFERA
jgi:hypothetical protein